MARTQAQAMLEAWEDGRAARSGERGLILLRLAEPTLGEDACRAFSVGRRDAALLDLHERLVGPAAHALVNCPACAEPLEFDVPLAAIRVTPHDQPPARFEAAHGDGAFTFRLPTAGDLAGLGAVAADDLISLCLLEDAAPAAPEVMEALEAAIGEAVTTYDPQAVVALALDCPACAAHWRSPFDIVEFLWRWFDGFARGLLEDVHVIASAYGWSEDQIRALPPQRRQRYLELIGG